MPRSSGLDKFASAKVSISRCLNPFSLWYILWRWNNGPRRSTNCLEPSHAPPVAPAAVDCGCRRFCARNHRGTCWLLAAVARPGQAWFSRATSRRGAPRHGKCAVGSDPQPGDDLGTMAAAAGSPRRTGSGAPFRSRRSPSSQSKQLFPQGPRLPPWALQSSPLACGIG